MKDQFIGVQTMDVSPTPDAATGKPEGRVRCLDGWRGLSILTVLMGHFLPIPSINLGRVGVEMFFVLSGRLMAEILFVNRFPLPDFFRRRIARVWPALAALVLTLWMVAAVSGKFHVGGVEAVSALTFTINYVLAAGETQANVFDHLWSLCIEEHAYFLLGLLAFVARRRKINVPLVTASLAALCIGNGIVQTFLGGDYFAVYWRTDVRAASILMCAALYLALRQGGWSRHPTGWASSAPVLWLGGLALSVNFFPDYIKYSAGTACFALAVCGLDKASGSIAAILEHPLLVRMGLWSYSLYLWQQPFYKLKGLANEAFGRITLHASAQNIAMNLGVRVLVLPAAFACALASFYLVEQPTRRYLNAHWGRPKGGPRGGGHFG